MVPFIGVPPRVAVQTRAAHSDAGRRDLGAAIPPPPTLFRPAPQRLMPIHHAIWIVGDPPVQLPPARLASEQQLEQMIARDPRILSDEWMLIGRQVPTPYAGRVDLLAIAPDGSLVVIELKRDRTPREIVAQALDYASWVEQLTAERIVQLYHEFSGGRALDDDFRTRFGVALDEDALNQSHQVVIVAAELDAATERIIAYLSARDIAINALFFQVVQHGAAQLLSRAWLLDPGETQVNVASTTTGPGEREPWNGEYYVSFGDPRFRSWADARDYGFISAGGGRWYSQTLKLLSPGDRVWVKVPQTGYVAVGRVTESARPVGEFTVRTPEGERPALDVLRHGAQYRTHADDPDTAEYFVRVRWLDALPLDGAVNEVGLFGNQNTVCRPATPKWRHTVERLKAHFPNWDAR